MKPTTAMRLAIVSATAMSFATVNASGLTWVAEPATGQYYQAQPHLISACTYQPNVLENGGAESGLLDGWDFDLGAWSVVSSQVHSGDFSFGVVNSYNRSQLVDLVAAGMTPNGLDKSTKFEYKTQVFFFAAVPLATYNATIALMDENENILATSQINVPTPEAGWTEYKTVINNLPDGVRYLSVTESGNVFSSALYFDSTSARFCKSNIKVKKIKHKKLQYLQRASKSLIKFQESEESLMADPPIRRRRR